MLVGRNWNQYALFEEMKALPNFTYEMAAYRDYPAIYANFDVYLSISSLEGGPIPLVEAMMSNAVPVTSRTGSARSDRPWREQDSPSTLMHPQKRLSSLSKKLSSCRGMFVKRSSNIAGMPSVPTWSSSRNEP